MPPDPRDVPSSRLSSRHLLWSSIAAALLLTGCESTPKMPKTPDLPSVPAMVEVEGVTSESDVTDRVGQAAITPLSDLNVVQQKIPAALLEARDGGAYAVPAKLDCPSVQYEITRLDVALGADFDAAGKDKPSLLERGGDMAENYGVGFVRRTMEGFVPFRSWLRKLTGAEKHGKDVAAAITAGGVRRAYLKGLRQGLGCPAPAPKAGEPAKLVEAAASASSPATTASAAAVSSTQTVSPAAPTPTPPALSPAPVASAP